jgi:hypothetical protein
MTKIRRDGADPAALDSRRDGALAAPENYTVLYETVDKKAVLSADKAFYEAWRLIVHRHASKAAERLTG